MMDDLISRQAVDKIINDLLENDNLQASPSVWNGLHMIKQLPSAQPERKTGWWICVGIGLMVTEYKCSECGRTVRDDTGYDVCKDYPYCHCGAKMMRKYGKR